MEETNVNKGIAKKGLIARLLVVTAVLGLSVATVAGAVEVDGKLKGYEKTSGVSGNLNSIGSDTLLNLMTFWAEKFREFYPNVNIGIEGKGSSTAPPALIEGTSQLGPMSRMMKGEEEDAFEKKFGYKPTPLRVAVDALAVFVNKDNPIACLSMEEVDAIFSKTQKRGHAAINTWGDAGMKDDWAKRPISLYGRNSASGTYGFFKEHTLKKGDYRDEVKEQPGSAAVVQSVAVERYAIGYSGIGYATPDVRALPISDKKGGKCYEANAENAFSGNYPLARFLYVYVNKAPGKPVDKLTAELLRLVYAKEGQEIVLKDGYYPLNATIASEELAKLK